MASYFDTSTPNNGAVFWSGNKTAASTYAENINGTIMEGTPGGKVFDNWDWLSKQYPEWNTGTSLDQKPIWEALSKQYANGATGKVTYVHPEDYVGHVWDELESQIIDQRIEDGLITGLKEVFVNGK